MATREVEFLKILFDMENLPMLEEHQLDLQGQSPPEADLGWLPATRPALARET